MEELTRSDKIIGALSYIIFILPFVNKSKKDFNKFHANQGLLLFIVIVLVSLANNILLPYLPEVISIIISLIFLFFIIYLFIFGVSSAANGTMKQFPLIGRIKILSKVKNK